MNEREKLFALLEVNLDKIERIVQKKANHGFIFACTNQSGRDLLEKFAFFVANKAYAYKVLAVKEKIFFSFTTLIQMVLYGIFIAKGEGKSDSSSHLFDW